MWFALFWFCQLHPEVAVASSDQPSQGVRVQSRAITAGQDLDCSRPRSAGVWRSPAARP